MSERFKSTFEYLKNVDCGLEQPMEPAVELQKVQEEAKKERFDPKTEFKITKKTIAFRK